MAEADEIKAKKVLIIVILLVLVFLGFMYFSKAKLVREVNEVIEEPNYGCKMVFNSEKDSLYSFVYYVRDTTCNNSIGAGGPYKIIKYRVNKKSLTVLKKYDKDVKWFKKLYERLDNVQKYDDKCKECIKIRDYNKDYYISLEDLKTFETLMQ